jgi:UDP-2,3-diacylglucosamine pyrophosphatase LpxH
MHKFDTVILSDIHLGSETSHTRELLEFLGNTEMKKLILNGDVFDDLRFTRLKSSHWKVLSRIRKLSKVLKLVWIRGNHDTLSAETLSHLLGIEVHSHYDWKYMRHWFYAEHGDRWDLFIYKHRFLSALFTRVHQYLQKHAPVFTEKLSKYLKDSAKFMSRNSSAIEYSAVRLAKRNGFSAVFCGHTHIPVLQKIDGVIYGNDGSWQNDVMSFIGIEGNNIGLYRYQFNKGTVLISALEIK